MARSKARARARRRIRILAKRPSLPRRAFNWIRGKTNEVEETGGRGWQALVGAIMGVSDDSVFDTWSKADQEAQIDKSDIVFACIAKIVSAAQEATLQIGKETEPGKPESFEADTTHPFNALIKQPNKRMDGNAYLGVVISHLWLTGESYTLELRDDDDQVAGLVPVPPSWVEEMKNQTTGEQIGWYIRQKNGRLEVPLEDMTRIYNPHPSDPSKPLSRLQAASQRVQVDEETGRYTAEMLVNAAVPSLVLKQPGGWTEKEKKDARQKLRDIAGKGNRGGYLFLSGEEAAADLLAPWKDIDLPGLTSLDETRICAVMGVPPIVIGLRSGLERSTFSNYGEARQAFFRETMISAWRNLESAFTKGFIVDEKGADKSLIFRFDLSSILELQEDANDRAERAVKLFAGSIITRNEARQLAGFESLENDAIGEVLLMPLNLLEVPANGDRKLTNVDREIAEVEEAGGLEGDRHDVPWLDDGDNGNGDRVSPPSAARIPSGTQ